MDEKTLKELLIVIICSLNKIEGLLMEPPQHRSNPITHYHYYTGVYSTPVVPLCTCRQYTPGSLTGGYFCPVHGQIF